MRSADDFSFVNVPRRLGIEDYQEAESSFVAKYASHPDTLAIYGFGSVTQPGISDLDFLVVMRPLLSRPLTREFGFDYFDEKTSYVLSHNPTVMPPDVFENYAKIFPLTGLRHVYGASLATAQLEPSAKWMYGVLALMYVSGHHYPTLFLQLLSAPTLNVRLAIQLLNALNHATGLYTSLSGQRPDDWAAFASAVSQLKASWFDLDSRQRLGTLVELLEHAAGISVHLLKKTSGLVQERLWRLKSPAQPARGFREIGRYLRDARLFGIMSDDFDPVPITRTAVEATFRWWRLLPAVYLLPLLEHGELDGLYSRQLRKGLSGNRSSFHYLDPLARDAVRASGALYNQLYGFHASNGISTLVSDLPGDAPLFAPEPRPSGLLQTGWHLAGKLRRELAFHRLMRGGGVHTQVSG